MQVDAIPPEQIRCWLEQIVPDKRPPLRSTMSGGNPPRIEFGGLTAKELEAFRSFENGASYLRVIDGRLHAYHVHEELPGPEEDPLIGPHWPANGEVKQYGGPKPGEGWHSPGIIITAVGAGRSSDEDRVQSQRTLTECGFDCLRSPRGEDGRYWEQWVLHYMLAAKGPLAAALKEWRARAKKGDYNQVNWWAEVEEAARIITRDLHVHYGSLDITIQRWALSCD